MADQKILNQIEYYFGDANMRRDKWLLEETKKDSEGYVVLSAICAFNKMKELGAEPSKVAEIAKDSDVVEVSEDKTKIRRKHPLPEQDDSNDRTLYAKGFPTDTTLEALQEFWAAQGSVLMITMRRIGKNFKGSVLVQFKSKEEVDAILAKKDTIKFNDQDLELKSFAEWDGEKKSTSQKAREEAKEKKRKLEEDKIQEKERQRQEFLDSLQTREIPQGLVLKVDSVPSGLRREDLSEHLKEFGKIKFIDFRQGQPTAFIRFEESFTEALEKAKEKKLGEESLALSMVEGDELKEYWIKLWTLQHDKQEASSTQNNRGGFKRRRN